jgi:hypothetical protein
MMPGVAVTSSLAVTRTVLPVVALTAQTSTSKMIAKSPFVLAAFIGGGVVVVCLCACALACIG